MTGVRVRSPLAAAAFVLAVIVTACSAAGCAAVHARAIGPALDTPAPPPRVVPVATPPIDSQPIVASPPVGEVHARPPAAIPQPPAPAPPVAIERPPAPNPEPPLTLRTTDLAAAEQRTRAALASATRDLGRIDVRALGPDARAQYDIARRFIAQATDALKGKNVEFAQQLADKAATMAALLQR